MNMPRVINRILQFEATYVRILLERPWFGLLTRNHSLRKQRQVKGCCKMGIYSRWSSDNSFIYHITRHVLDIDNTKCVIYSTQNTRVYGSNFISSSSLAFTILTYLLIPTVNYEVMNLPYFSEMRLAHHVTKERTNTTQNMWPAVRGSEIRTRDSSIRGGKDWQHLRPRYFKIACQIITVLFATSFFKALHPFCTKHYCYITRFENVLQFIRDIT